jgi:hypothetical protein
MRSAWEQQLLAQMTVIAEAARELPHARFRHLID